MFIFVFPLFMSGEYNSENVFAAVKLGDINLDQKIDSLDYSWLRRFLNGTIDNFPDVDNLLVADLDADKSINSVDYSLMRKYIINDIDEFPGQDERDLEISEKVDDLLAQMTLEEKVGQMIQGEYKQTTPEEVNEYYLGSVLSGGGSNPLDNTPETWTEETTEYQEQALATRLGIPILYGIDAVHGNNHLEGAVIFPHNIGLGAANDAELMRKIGRITAEEVLVTGVHWNFAPVVAVARDERWGRTYESYSENTDIVNKLSVPYIEGFQEYNLAATAKHYIADGGTKYGTGQDDYKIDQGDAQISEEELREIHLPPYIKAIEADVKTIMVSFSSWNGVKLHEHEYLITDVLKDELGFEGFVVSDWEAIHQIPSDTFYDQVVASINAGVDMLMEPFEWQESYEAIIEGVNNEDISIDRINDAVKRILKVKYEIGLFEYPFNNRDLLTAEFGSEENREVAREAVRKSMVLLKNENDILPLSKDQKIYVAGYNSHNMGNQCGGWTISWQGSNLRYLTEGTTILEGIENAIAGQGEVVEDMEDADVAVIVAGERPYAEGLGDDDELKLRNNDKWDARDAKEAGLPVVTVLVSGRPMIVTEELENWDAFVAAWLPGTEGQGVSDVLFGDYDFTGKLPYTWPKSIDQLPINVDNMEGKDPLYPFGYGLSYE